MMTRTQHFDWDPRSESIINDPIPAYDAMRQRCPVAHSEYQHWSVFRHADVLKVLHDHRTFSNSCPTGETVAGLRERVCC